MRWFLYFLAVLLCGAANAQTMGGSSSLVIGSTVISGCTSTTGVLFNNNGVPGCDAGFTKAAGASGAVTVGGVFTVQSSILLGGANGSVQIPNGGTYIWGNGTKLTSSSSGVVQFQNNGNTQNFNLSTAANNLASFNGVVGGLGHLSTGVAFASLPTATAGWWRKA